MPGPLKPDEVIDNKTAQIPDFVFDAFNKMIAKHWNGYTSTFTQNDVIDEIISNRPNLDTEVEVAQYRRTIFDSRWLDVEDSYRAVGWMVIYDKPAYNETNEALFTFSKA